MKKPVARLDLPVVLALRIGIVSAAISGAGAGARGGE